LHQKLKAPQLVASPVTVRTKSRLMEALVAQLLPLVEQIAAYDKEIAQLFLKHPDSGLWALKPVVGARLAPRL
jgi:hypothetical protein